MQDKIASVNTAIKKDKILLIITKSVFGGAGRYVYELALRFAKEGSEVAVALGGDGMLKQKLKDAGIKIYSIEGAQRDMSITKEIKALWSLFSIIKNYKPTIVHLNSPKIGGLGAVAARLFRVRKIIYTNHGWPFKESRPAWQLLLIRFFSWLTVFLGEKTIVLSETERDFVKNWPFINKKIVVIPNGLSPFELKSKEEALLRLVGEEKKNKILNNGDVIVGTISELHKNKGLSCAIEGICLYKDHLISSGKQTNIIFIVMGEGERRKELENLIDEKNLKENVLLVGNIDNAREYLKAFDIFLLSSIKEGLPYAILESGYAEVPVISTSVGGIPEVIKNLETGLLIPPKRPTEIKNALIYIEEHPEIKETVSLGLKNKVSETFAFDKIAEKIKELYKN